MDKCPHCREAVDIKATRCPHCHGKIFRWTVANKFIAIGAALITLLFMIGVSSNDSSPSVSAPVPSSPQIGETAYLRLPGISDPTQVICLGTTKEEFDQIGKALSANDFAGIMEIPGAFCLSNGTQVKVIDSDVGLRRVRIIKGIRKVDADKVLLSGWTAKEWVVR